MAAATAIGSVPGLIKELYDGNWDNNVFSGKDMTVTLAGGCAGPISAHFINK